MSTIVIDRCVESHNWIAYHGSLGSGNSFVLETHGDARDAVKEVQATHPTAEVGVRSKVFGAATQRCYGPVVWMKPNLD